MESFYDLLENLEGINQHYDLSVERLHAIREEFNSAKVCTPLIGKFSSGKSALLNTLLGYGNKLLSEDIAPATAVPTELEYVDVEPAKPVDVYFKGREPQSCSLQDYREMTLDANSIDRVHIRLCVSTLAQFPDVQLVDMPGFESGLEVHNRAIDGYLGNSMAYLVVFPVDDMVLRSTIGSILKELCLHEMPLAIVITKCDKEDSDEAFEEKKEALRQSLKRYIGERELRWCPTSSFDGRIESLVRFLREVQAQARELRVRRFHAILKPEIENTERYLQSQLNGTSLSESELAVQEDKLREEDAALQKELAELFENFRRKIPQCVSAISGEVRGALHDSEGALVAMVMNKQDINEQLNSTVRGAVTRGVQEHYLPLVRQYMQGTSDVGIDLGIDMNIYIGGFNLDANMMTAKIVAGVVAGAAAFVDPLGVILLHIFLKHREKQKREEAKNAIRSELNQRVFPQIIGQVEKGLAAEIDKHAQSVKRVIKAQGDTRRALLEKSMTDLRSRMADEQQKKERAAAQMQADLKQLEVMRNEL